VSGPLKRQLAAAALFLLAMFIAGAMLSERLASNSGQALFGPVGAYTSLILRYWLGVPTAALVPVVLAAQALLITGRIFSEGEKRWSLFLLGATHLAPIALGIPFGRTEPDFATSVAGAWGNVSAQLLRGLFGAAGAWVAFLLLVSAHTAWTLFWHPLQGLLSPRHARVRGTARGDAPTALALEPPPEEMPSIDEAARESGQRRRRPAPPVQREGADHGPSEAVEVSMPKARGSRMKGEAPLIVDDTGPPLSVVVPEADALEDKLPSPDLLTPPPPGNVDEGRDEIQAMGVKLMAALRTFKVEGKLVGRTVGPVVTQFEIEPAEGVKVRQFANLANDLALAMRAPSIRVVAPIPGRGAVGVEVPNPVPQVVSFRELIEAKEFAQARMALPIALGKDLEGKVVVADLAKMPHLLIAGATGSGKSVCVNTIITSLAYRHTADTLKFLMVDPKMVELSVYNDLPHLLHKVITDNRDAAYVLKWAVMEMQRRYEILAANGARNIQDFNKRVLDGASLVMPTRPEVAFERREYTEGILPYVVLVIDELADLMMTVQGEVETPLAMLAQKARAIGIHIILATQRPSVNVITGLIKANFPSRIAFRVASQVDSRTIIDGMGAESLLGNGDMLFIPPGKSEPQRLQGAFIPGEDTERLMQWFDARKLARRAARAAQGLPDEELARVDLIAEMKAREALENEEEGEEGGEGSAGSRDPLFRRAAETCVQHQLGSTSLLQRRLGIGYGRAARIIDQLHAAGVLGPSRGSKPRDILIGLDDLDRIAPPDPGAP